MKDRFAKLQHLTDHPVEEDLLAGGAHARTAKALVDTIINEQTGGKAIGLEGTWGSGKSSVVEIARQQLEKGTGHAKSIYVFTFDVWSHQGDPLKRAFLEKFNNWLKTKNLIKTGDHDSLAKKIQARIKQTTTRTEQKLSLVGWIMVGLAPVIPLLYVWLSPFGFGGYVLPSVCILGICVAAKYLHATFFILLLLPYIAVLINWAWIRGGFSGLERSVSLLSGTNGVQLIHQDIRDEDPTSVEFGKFLEKMLAAISQNAGKIVVVLDNLDRLPLEQISDAWATMRSLLARENIWLIVPYDRTYMQSVFQSERGDREGNGSSRSESFFEKTFGVILRVSPPLLSHWKDYFFEQISIAFPDSLSETEKHKLFRFLEYHFVDSHVTATPRSIKFYINGIVSILLQWGSEIPVECVALYVLKRSIIQTDQTSLKDGSLLDPKHLALLEDQEWQKFLATLHFNVAPEDAYQILLSGDVERALKSGNIEYLRELSGNPGFEMVLSSIIEDKAFEWAAEAPSSFALACQTLYKLESTGPAFDQMWCMFSSVVETLGKWDSLNETHTAGLLSLVDALEPNSAWNAAQAIIRSLTNLTDSLKDDLGAGSKWLNVVDQLQSAIQKKASRDEASWKLSNIMIPGTGKFFCGAAGALAKAKVSELSDFKPSVNMDDLTKTLVAYIGDDDLVTGLPEMFSTIFLAPGLVESEPVANALRNRLYSNSPELDHSEMAILTLCLIIQRNGSKDPQVANKFTELANDGTFLSLFKEGVEDGHPGLAAYTFWCLADAHGNSSPPNPGSHPTYGDISAATNSFSSFMSDFDEYPKILGEIVNLVNRQHKFGRIFKLAIDSNEKTVIYQEVLRQTVDRKAFTRLSVDQVFLHYDKLAEILGDELELKFMKQFAGWSSHFEEELVGDVPAKVSEQFLRTAHRTSDHRVKIVFELVEKYLKGLEPEDWSEALSKENKSLQLLFGMLATTGISLSPGKFREPLLKHAKSVVNDGVLPKQYSDRWSELPKALASQSENKFYRDLFLSFSVLDLTEANLRQFFFLYKDFLDKSPIESSPDLTVEKIIYPFLAEPNNENLQLVENYSQKLGKCIEDAKPEMKALIDETVEGVIASSDKAQKEVIRAMVGTLGLPPLTIENSTENAGNGDQFTNDS